MYIYSTMILIVGSDDVKRCIKLDINNRINNIIEQNI